MKLYRIAGIILAAGLALFLITVLVKLLLVAAATVLLVRVVGGYVMHRMNGSLNRGGWSPDRVISIDNPAYRSPLHRANYGLQSEGPVRRSGTPDVSVIAIG